MELPPVVSECDYQWCSYDSDNAVASLSRCSVCKNQFYCSPRSQKLGWATHKFDCSAFPSVDGPPASEVLIDDDFKSEVARLATILEGISTQLESVGDRIPASMVAPILSLNIPPHLEYTQKPVHHEHCKYKLPLTNIARLFFIDLVAAIQTEEERQEFIEVFGSLNCPSYWPQLYAPKLFARPADLSPGEYEMIWEVATVYAMNALPGDTKWMHFRVVAKRVFRAGTPQAERA